MWLSARGNGIDNIVWQQQDAHHHNQGTGLGLELNNTLWYPGSVYPGIPRSRLSTDHCLSLRVMKRAWNYSPGKPYFTQSCSDDLGYSICEGKVNHALPMKILEDTLYNIVCRPLVKMILYIIHKTRYCFFSIV